MSTVDTPARESTLDRDTAKKVRHTLSTALSFLTTAGKNVFGAKPDPERAKRIYEIGTTKLNGILSALDRSIDEDAESEDYTGTIEPIYTGIHPGMIEWTRRFEGEVARQEIFSEFERRSPRSLARAEVVGALWYRFSDFMPWFLCQAAAKVSTNVMRHFVIQTAFEELGARDMRAIHAEMFWNAAQTVGCAEGRRRELLADRRADQVLDDLKTCLLSYRTDEETLGILLGLEIPAMENIETLFRSLAHSPEFETQLDRHRFFRLHRTIEIEHVRLTVSNFLRFCDTEEKRAKFMTGFMDGIAFWKAFWEMASVLIEESGSQGGRDAR